MRTTHSSAEEVERLRALLAYTKPQEFRQLVTNRRVTWWPREGKDREMFPDTDTTELKDCQPFVERMLELFQSGELELKQQKRGSKATKVSITVRSVPLPNAYETKILGAVSPDMLFFDGSGNELPASITMVGQVKGGGRGLFPLNEQGDVIDAMVRVMHAQPFRHQLFGVLTGGRRFMFLRCIRDASVAGDFRYEYSDGHDGIEGWQVIFFGVILASFWRVSTIDSSVVLLTL
jgi:hypothetical protein